jgi:hypothetical protein
MSYKTQKLKSYFNPFLVGCETFLFMLREEHRLKVFEKRVPSNQERDRQSM